MTDQAVVTAAPEAADGKIVCQIDNARVHSVASHIKRNHADTWTLERYQAEFPDAPVLSDKAKAVLEKQRLEREQDNQRRAGAVSSVQRKSQEPFVRNFATFHDTFDLGNAAAARNAIGDPIEITVLNDHDDASLAYLPDIDRSYVFDIDLLKKVIIGFQLNMPTYLWGFHGTGKTTMLQQAAARTGRPFMRVQHTINMQESDILGQWVVKDGATVFQLGPLPMAMINGWVFCADEYDFAMPSVIALYQPVLEGQALLIKDAPKEFRKIVPHPDFRFVATGNTNGIGDETGLYQGTLVQNAASYSRFAITEEVKYMDPKIETSILVAKGGIPAKDAKNVVKFANQVRTAFGDGKITMTISPRELISACQLAAAYGGKYSLGLQLAFANRLSRVDRKTVIEFLQRLFDQ